MCSHQGGRGNHPVFKVEGGSQFLTLSDRGGGGGGVGGVRFFLAGGGG